MLGKVKQCLHLTYLLVTIFFFLNGPFRRRNLYMDRLGLEQGAVTARNARLHERLIGTEGVAIFNPKKTFQSKPCASSNGIRVALNYGSYHYSTSIRRSCLADTSHDWIDACIATTPTMLDPKFRARNSDILASERGGGYWLWKPYVTLRTLYELDEGDILFYHDVDHKLANNLEEIICVEAGTNQDIVPFYMAVPELQWTKGDAFVLMNIDGKNIRNSVHASASYLLMTRRCDSLRFIGEWLTYSQDSRILTDKSSQFSKEVVDFQSHRHDQSILSLNSKKWNLTLWSVHITQVASHQSQYQLFNPLTYDMIPAAQRPTKILLAPN